MRRSPGKTRLALTAALLLVAGMVAVFAVRQPAPPQSRSNTPAVIMTLDPRIIANLTQLPQATALAGQAANDLTALRAMVDACPAYDDARRSQMVQTIGYIINPSGLSREAILAFGGNLQGNMLKALATYTLNRWRLDEAPADSCLIPIGKRINEMLVAAGEPPVAAFEGE
jgi:hypothetical protein